MPPFPELPVPAHDDLDSMLSRKFGKEVANYFAGNPLSRVGFLRGDHNFLSQAIRHPSTSVLLFRELQPLTTSPDKLAYVSFKDVQPVVGEDPYIKSEEQMISEYNSSTHVPQIVFLGLDSTRQDGIHYQSKNLYSGAPYFAIDVTPKGSLEKAANGVIHEVESRGLKFAQGRMHMSLPSDEAAIYALARSLIDWNTRNPFCAGCGQPTLSVSAGFKRTCPPTDYGSLKGALGSTTAAQPDQRPDCATRKGISNLCFPRTDPTIIVAVVSHDGRRCLVGRQNRWPPHFYSTLAGFCEPAESIEEAVRREVWEEAGVTLGRVVIHSTQPWPYPANLMIGAIAQTIPEGETIDLGHDPELDDAKWCTVEEIREALKVGVSNLDQEAGPEYKEGGLRLPPATAIANQLLTAVCNGFVAGQPKM